MPLFVATAAFLLALLVTLGVNSLGLLRWQATEKEHWTERARILFPKRRSAALNIWLIPTLCVVAELTVCSNKTPIWAVPTVIIASWFGAVLGTYPFDKRLFPQFSFPNWMRFVLVAWILRLGSLGLLVCAGVIMPDEFGWMAVLLGGATLGFLLALNYGLWVRIAARLGIFRRALDSEPIADIVRQLSAQMQIPCGTIWKMRSPVGYAAAMVTTRDLIFSEGLLNSHPAEEIAAICAHELAHLSEPRRVHRTRLIMSLSWFPLVFARPAINLIGPIAVSLLLVPRVLLQIYFRRLSRRMELRADSVASGCEQTPGVYARALERLYRNNHMPAVMASKRRTHPDLYDRLLSAGITPDYPRPRAPRGLDWSSGLVVLLFVLFLIAYIAVRACMMLSINYNG